MARGITQAQVDAAADALLQGGERPTIERVRQALGTGSPNTVTRLLDVWWKGLSERLQAREHKLALPEAPAAVAALASKLWEQALRAGRAEAEQALEDVRQELAAERTALDQHGAELRQQVATAARATAEAQTLQRRAEAQLQGVQQLVDQLQAQLVDCKEQRDAAGRRASDAEADAASLRSRVTQAEDAMRQEREAHAAHLRTVENRAYAEVDRARQELKSVRAELRTGREQHRRREAALESEVSRLQRELAGAAKALAVEQVRCEAIERQSAELQNALRAALTEKPSDAEAKRTRTAAWARPRLRAPLRRRSKVSSPRRRAPL
ncbi:DNA-binding protein [Novilysobacter defluvii]|uniref:KfrA N-terminal DNA-binding domain-containing protein n=1 Tax=Lysobacter defluvii IMMIB APB-9 = DSM 18482 TaxID=1385515 RepID=A0A0A0M9U9_9GAMM|nr:DNA-binding protein [Lysobacter defluvii]KGO99833.1 hypothetical protein N791_09915 [Lysobacter defluvii IMMIB APB-9 = DSM 18482]